MPIHLERYESLYGIKPSAVVADAGYGSDENHQFLGSRDIGAYIKYNTFDKEQKEGLKAFGNDSLHYNENQACLYCPMGQRMDRIGQKLRKTTSGYVQTLRQYQAKNCQGCPMRGVCHSGKGNRIVDVNHSLRGYKEQAKEKLNSPQGITYRKKTTC